MILVLAEFGRVEIHRVIRLVSGITKNKITSIRAGISRIIVQKSEESTPSGSDLCELYSNWDLRKTIADYFLYEYYNLLDVVGDPRQTIGR